MEGEYSHPARGFRGFLYLPCNKRAVGVASVLVLVSARWLSTRFEVVVEVSSSREVRRAAARASSHAWEESFNIHAATADSGIITVVIQDRV